MKYVYRFFFQTGDVSFSEPVTLQNLNIEFELNGWNLDYFIYEVAHAENIVELKGVNIFAKKVRPI